MEEMTEEELEGEMKSIRDDVTDCVVMGPPLEQISSC